jgi:hypothetical protein
MFPKWERSRLQTYRETAGRRPRGGDDSSNSNSNSDSNKLREREQGVRVPLDGRGRVQADRGGVWRTIDGGTRDGASSVPHVHVVRLDVARRAPSKE